MPPKSGKARRRKSGTPKETQPTSTSALPSPSLPKPSTELTPPLGDVADLQSPFTELTRQLATLEIKEAQPTPPLPTNFPPWVELPADITCNILQRLGMIEILENAQKVCSAWYTACKNPAMWRVVDMFTDDDEAMHLEEMCRSAVDRSQGQVVELNLDQLFSNEELIDHIAPSCGNVKRLKLLSYLNLPDGGVAEAMLKKFPKLASLDIAVYTRYYSKTIEMVASTCPLLTSFALKKIYFGRSSFEFHTEAFGGTSADDDEAEAIARSMPNLRHLQLIENNMTTAGLKAILESCRHLESLVLHRCFFLKLEEESDLVERMVSQIKDVKCTECTYPEHLKEINWHDM